MYLPLCAINIVERERLRLGKYVPPTIFVVEVIIEDNGVNRVACMPIEAYDTMEAYALAKRVIAIDKPGATVLSVIAEQKRDQNLSNHGQRLLRAIQEALFNDAIGKKNSIHPEDYSKKIFDEVQPNL